MALAAACSGGDDGSEEEETPTATATRQSGATSTPTVERADGEIVFAVIGDYGDDDDDTRQVADMIIGWQPDFIVTVGDNDYSDGAYAGSFEGLELGVGQYFADFIGNYRGEHGAGSATDRFFPVPGDHDWGDNCDNPSALDDYLAYFTLPDDSPGGERYYTFRRGPVQFFAIDSPEGCEPDGVTADSAQAQWVREQAAQSDAPFKVAITHHAPYTSGDHGPDDGEQMRWPWADWGFDLVLSGHDHDYERLERDGITYVVNGLGGNDRRGFRETVDGSLFRYWDAHGAMLVRVSGADMTLSFINVSGDIIDTFTLTAG
jgi:hypothetical protein